MTDYTELNRKVAELLGFKFRANTTIPVTGWHHPVTHEFNGVEPPPFATDAALWAPLLAALVQDHDWTLKRNSHTHVFIMSSPDDVGVDSNILGEAVCLAYIAQREREGE